VFKHLRVPLLPHLVLAFLPVLLSMPLPQYEVFLYSLILSISVALARFEETGAVLDNPRGVAAFVALIGAMRQKLGTARGDDLSLVLFGQQSTEKGTARHL
jgi:hypothetical protein